MGVVIGSALGVIGWLPYDMLPLRLCMSDSGACPGGCPVIGTCLQGAPHLREVFSRMGFDDKDIVALSGKSCAGR